MKASDITLAVLLAGVLLAGSAMAATPKAKTCAEGTIGGVVKEVKKVGNKTVMSFQGTKFTITIPSERPEAKALAKVKPGTLHCETNDEDI